MANLVIVTDAIREFEAGPFNSRMDRIAKNMHSLLARKKSEGYKIIFLGDRHKAGDRELRILPEHAMEGTESTEIIFELRQFLEEDGSNYIPKQVYSGLFRTDLLNIIRKEKPDTIIIAGVCTDICVLHLAINLYYVQDLLDRDIEFVVPRNCVETFDNPDHPADVYSTVALSHMKNMLGFKIVETEAEI